MATLRIPTQLRSTTGGQSVLEVEGATIGEVLENLRSSHPLLIDQIVRDGALHRFVNVYVNDDDVRYLGGLETPVAERDEITILPAVAGG